MREGEQGNLTVRMPERKTGDEISQVGISFNRMMERITTLVRQTNDSAKQVLETAGQLT
ncbi:HAMP domain-containing protein [Paenibacillus larvae]